MIRATLRTAMLAATVLALWTVGPAGAKELRFSGYDFIVRPAGTGGPGPNRWDPRNAWVDEEGRLHLKLARRNGRWYAAEVYTKERLGFGRYQFWIEGRLDQLDQNVVVGLFNYPTADVGADGTNEIDIEFARWGDPAGKVGNYTVWPVRKSLGYTTRRFAVPEGLRKSTHRFDWRGGRVWFRSFAGHRNNNRNAFAQWTFRPADPADRIGRKPMPLHINIWGHKGNPPANGVDAEIIIRAFRFTPL